MTAPSTPSPHSHPVVPPFHLAFPVHCVEAARDFYGGLLQCPEGRSAELWVDFNLFGHQIVAHVTQAKIAEMSEIAKRLDRLDANPVDGHDVPVPHFGVILPWDTWQQLAARLRDAALDFVIEPYIRFAGEVGEQATMFFLDPSNNALEFKSLKNIDQLFAK